MQQQIIHSATGVQRGIKLFAFTSNNANICFNWKLKIRNSIQLQANQIDTYLDIRIEVMCIQSVQCFPNILPHLCNLNDLCQDLISFLKVIFLFQGHVKLSHLNLTRWNGKTLWEYSQKYNILRKRKSCVEAMLVSSCSIQFSQFGTGPQISYESVPSG